MSSSSILTVFNKQVYQWLNRQPELLLLPSHHITMKSASIRVICLSAVPSLPALTDAASQHNENAINFFQQFLFAPPLPESSSNFDCEPDAVAILWLLLFALTAQLGLVKKKCWCLLWGSFYEGGATIAAAEAAQGSLMPSFCVPSPGQPFALNEETNYSRL